LPSFFLNGKQLNDIIKKKILIPPMIVALCVVFTKSSSIDSRSFELIMKYSSISSIILGYNLFGFQTILLIVKGISWNFLKQPSIAAVTPRCMFLIHQLPYWQQYIKCCPLHLSTFCNTFLQYLFAQRSALEYANEPLTSIPDCRWNEIWHLIFQYCYSSCQLDQTSELMLTREMLLLFPICPKGYWTFVCCRIRRDISYLSTVKQKR
jgi:hypothetical protein